MYQTLAISHSSQYISPSKKEKKNKKKIQIKTLKNNFYYPMMKKARKEKSNVGGFKSKAKHTKY